MSTKRAITVYVPVDSSAVAVGADEVAAALADYVGVDVVRTGSRGMLWLEPLVEVDTPAGRVGYPNVTPGVVAGLIHEGLLSGAEVGGSIGVVGDYPWLARQRRVSFARVGIIEPTSIADYESHGGWSGLRRALELDPAAVVEEVATSGLRGRGGAGFPTGVKWGTVLEASADLFHDRRDFHDGQVRRTGIDDTEDGFQHFRHVLPHHLDMVAEHGDERVPVEAAEMGHPLGIVAGAADPAHHTFQ